jgi:ParB family transcriptional regulator, chromosome partitioning protein
MQLELRRTESTLPALAELELWQLELRYAALRIARGDRHRQLVAMLAAQGQQTPVLVVAGERDDFFVLIDGYERVAALRELGRDTAQALVLPLDEPAALSFDYRLGAGRRRTALEQGWLVLELIEQHGRKPADVAFELGHSPSWVSRRLGLVRELPERVQVLVRQGQLCPHAAMVSLLPLSRCNGKRNDRAVVEIAEAATREKLSSRQIATLCRAWRAASIAQRERLLAQPSAYLKLDDAFQNGLGPRCRTQSDQPRLVRDLEILASVSRRIEGRLLGRAQDEQGDEGQSEALLLVWPRAQQAFESLTRHMQARIHAGLGNTDDHFAPES